METNNNIDSFKFLPYLGKILLCRNRAGKEFMSRLIAIEGNDLIFENRRGHKIRDEASSIAYFAEVSR